MVCENFLVNKLIKYNNNNGYVLKKNPEDQKIHTLSNLANAFSHWTFEYTEGKLIVVDL